jgi:CubicO group peptidase (beta-lactamase class C family)
MRSVSKSFVGLLAGIAIGEGAINPSAPVLDYFPSSPNLRNPERNAINVEHLLTMSSGLHWEETLATYGGFANDETHLYWAWNPDRLVLSRALDASSGTRFNYSGGNTAVLADIIERTTKTSLRDYVRNKFRAVGHQGLGMDRRSLVAADRLRGPATAPARPRQGRPHAARQGAMAET